MKDDITSEFDSHFDKKVFNLIYILYHKLDLINQTTSAASMVLTVRIASHRLSLIEII